MSSQVILTRRSVFSASHRLVSNQLSQEQNQKLFGKCFHANGHGHNYELEVSLKGPVDPKTGIVMNLTELKSIIDEAVLSKVDHKHLNLDVEEFRSLNPTTENLAIVIWGWLKSALPSQLLYEIKIKETENNIVTYRGE